MTVDAHFHVWDPQARKHAWLSGEDALRRPFSIARFTELAAHNGVEQAVLVQVLNDLDETYEFLAVASRNPIVAGVIGWVDLEAPDLPDVIEALREAVGGERLVGIRHLVEAEPDPAYLERPTVVRGLHSVADAGLVFDLLVRPLQLPSALQAIRSVENLLAVLDHGGKPTIAHPGRAWSKLVAGLAKTKRVACKFSGLVSEAGPAWTEAAIRPVVDELLEVFGADQLMFGSDWPVCTLVAAYPDVCNLLTSCIHELSTGEQDAIRRGTATAVYGLTGE
jgi:L-fuconolactonase